MYTHGEGEFGMPVALRTEFGEQDLKVDRVVEFDEAPQTLKGIET